MFNKIHEKIGDLWWYSAMIFIACRSGDVIQAFIGLWLVPKYVGAEELGAVIPLQQLSSLFAVPIAVLATVFSKFVNTYATHGEFGKVKCFIRDVFCAASLIFLVCIIVAYLVVPHFYERLRITSGTLTVLILTAGFTANVSQLFTNALQGLKRFNILTVVNLISAPIRLITLLVAMPFRALSGYILGQATPPASTSIVAAIAIHRQLRHTPADSSWRRDIPAILRYLWPVAIYTAFSALFSTISSTIYRQRLPEIESAAYYLISRFAEVAGYVGLSMMVVLFPVASEAHERGSENTTALWHTIFATVITTIILSILFSLTGHYILSTNNTWADYIPYANLMLPTTLITGIGTIIGIIISYDMACRRFLTPYIILCFNFCVNAILVSFTGWEFYRGILPNNIVDWIADHNLSSLTRLTYFNIASATIQIAILLWTVARRRKHNSSQREAKK